MDVLYALFPFSTDVHPALTAALCFCAFNCFWTYVGGELSGNYSQVDRVWTFLPVLYTAWFTFCPPLYEKHTFWGGEGLRPRAVMMFSVQVVWMSRLTYNTFRRGLFSLSEEDYRWAIFRDRQPVWVTKVFHLVFIAIIQNLLLLGLGIPAYLTLLAPQSPLLPTDIILCLLCLLAVLFEFIADNQQHSYQSYKYRTPEATGKSFIAWPGAQLKWTEDDRKRGFVSRGLWAWARHPNFACEQLFWTFINLFPLLALPSNPVPPTDTPCAITPILPSLCLSLLFCASTSFTESITAPKYPAYRSYQLRVAKFSPLWTVFKGLWLKSRGRKEAAESVLWGKDPLAMEGFDKLK